MVSSSPSCLWSPAFPCPEAVLRNAGVNPGKAVITVQNAERMPASWGLGVEKWDSLPGTQLGNPHLSPFLEEPGPLGHITELNCPLNSPLQRGEAWGLWEGVSSGQGIRAEGAGHN